MTLSLANDLGLVFNRVVCQEQQIFQVGFCCLLAPDGEC